MRAQMGVLVLFAWAGCAEESGSRPAPRNAVNAEGETQAQQEMTLSAERSDAIERLFARKTAELQSCWADEYERNHDRKLEGDVTVQLHISPAGTTVSPIAETDSGHTSSLAMADVLIVQPESDPARPRYLETETGVGYRLRSD